MYPPPYASGAIASQANTSLELSFLTRIHINVATPGVPMNMWRTFANV